MSIIILLLALALWGTVHSILASNFAKDMLGGASFYRLGYNIFAGVSFLPILYLMKILHDQRVYTVPSPWNILMYGGQLLAALLLAISLLQTDVLSFIGLRQLFEDQNNTSLVTSGFYRYMRHPLYTFSLLFIWLTPGMTQNSLAVYFGATIYVLVGAYFEERKLLRDFGQAYADYKNVTPMLIPGLMLGKN
jgi:methanethiol S-methyltransferase